MAAQFTLAKCWKRVDGKRWHMHTVEHYSAERKELLPCVTAWREPDGIVLREGSQAERTNSI